MALIVKDRVKESSTTTGTADFTLGGAAAGFQTFAVIGNTNTTYYAAVDQATGDWEVGVGTYSSTGPTLTRDTVLESSNSGSKVNFAAGSKDVFCTYPAERSVYLDAAGSAVSVLDIGTLGVSTANITTANITAGTITTTPASGNDLVNKTYVDTAVSSGIHFHEPVRVESPINLNATYNNGTAGVGATLTNAGTQVALVVDGVTVATNDRVLVYEQPNQTQNGIYVVTNTGSGSTNWVLTRASDADTYAAASSTALGEGSTVFVQQGATGAGETYVCNTIGTITFGTTNITFAQISSAQIYSAGTGLTLSGTQFSITNVGTAGTYGSASSVPVLAINAQGQVTSATPTAIAIAAAAVSGLAASATTDTTNAANITSGTLPTGRLNGSYTGITGVGTLAAGTWNASTIGATFGGTGLTSYVQGDLLYATSPTTVGSLADVVAGNALLSGGVGGDPAWGKVGLDTHVTGTLLVANGGTGATTLTGYVIGNGTGAFTASTSIPNAATTATSANTASAIVARDGSGNFSAGTITASLNGNASTATTAANVNNGTLSLGVSGTGLSGSASFTANQSGNSTFTVTSNATNANTAGAIVARDGSGNFSAGTITASLSGNATTSSSTTGNAATATTLQTARNINEVAFNGSANITIPRVQAIDDRTAAPADGSAPYATFGFGSWNNNNTSPYADNWILRSYTDSSGGADNMVSFRKDVLGMRVWQQTYGSATAFSTFKDVAWTDGTNASGTWGINVTGSAGSASTATNQSGGTVSATTGAFSSTLTSNFAPASINTTTPGLTNYGYVFNGTSSPDNAQAITWTWTSGGGAQAGIYVQSSGAYGTRMYLATTDSFATGARTAISISEAGAVNIVRAGLAVAGRVSSGGNNGFANATFFSGERNPIWYFGNATTYGVSYFQGSSGIGGNDTIGIHPNGTATAAGSSFAVVSNGNCIAAGRSSGASLGLNGGFTISDPGSGYGLFNNWVQLPGFHGFYSPQNGAHLLPNNLTYGSWRIDGSRNGWQGIEFSSQMTLMMNDNACGVHRNTGGGWRFYVEGNSLFCGGNITAYWSDERLKENLRKMDREALTILGQMDAFRFNWNSKVAEIGAEIPVGKEEIGLIAQHVQRALPDAVVVNKAGAKVGDKDFDYLTINYDRITPLLVEGVNIHDTEISHLKDKVARLEALVEKLIGDSK